MLKLLINLLYPKRFSNTFFYLFAGTKSWYALISFEHKGRNVLLSRKYASRNNETNGYSHGDQDDECLYDAWPFLEKNI